MTSPSPVHVHDYGAARIPCSQDHGDSRPLVHAEEADSEEQAERLDAELDARVGDSRQSEGRDIIAKAIHRSCPSRVKHGFAYHWPEAEAALAAAAPKEEPR